MQNGESLLVFAKAKVAHMKAKSLPTLELLAIKCLLPLLKAYSRIRIEDILISVDAQVVLLWLLSDNIKTKNQFVKYRLKDIHQMIREVKEEKSLLVKFRYVHTDLNPAGRCPRGVMVKAMDWEIVVSEFELHSRYYVHFWTNTLGKGMNPLPSQLWVK